MRDKLMNMCLAIGHLILTFFIHHAAYSECLNLKESDRSRIIGTADAYLTEMPITITASHSPRSAGGLHDYFSEGDYWWPDPKNPDGPYIQKDGLTNPDNFVSHRQALMRFSVQVATLVAAYKITDDEKYAAHAILHLKAWFIDNATRMSPHLQYAQAIKGKMTGRGIGIIDTIHFIEIVKAVEALESSPSLTHADLVAIKQWFNQYLEWMTTHQYGIDEREAKNNHGTCWVMQVAAFAELVGDTAKMEYCRKRFKEILLPNQMGTDGSFPLEIKRTKPYGYSLFNLEAMAGICQILSTNEDNLWIYTLPDGRNMRKAMEFIYPYIKDKSKWPYPADVMYFENWPVRQSSLLFAGIALNAPKYISLWNRLNPDPVVEEVIRNFPIRQPIIWMGETSALLGIRLMDTDALNKIRKQYINSDQSIMGDIKHLIRESDKILNQKPMSVMDKEQAPPGGDKHDYMSVAPYWWPDSTKSDGLPYIRRDGEKNPDRDKVGDRKRIGDMIESVQNLAITYFITRDERYAGKASVFLRVWFLDTAKRMNPNLTYAQSVRGVSEGRGAGIIDTYKFTDLIDAIHLLECSAAWQEHDRREITKWFDEYLTWLLESENGMSESKAKNNHGTTYAVQVSAIAMFVGRDSLAENIVRRIPAERIATQIEPDGKEPLELVRTKSWGYCMLNLEGLIQLAQIGEYFGIDLWDYQTDDGRSIRKVIDWLVPIALGKKKWAYPQIVPMEVERMYPVLQLAAKYFHDTSYANAALSISSAVKIKPQIKMLFQNIK
jgi:hypothetical protein